MESHPVVEAGALWMIESCTKKQTNRAILAHFPHARIKDAMMAIIKTTVISEEDWKWLKSEIEVPPVNSWKPIRATDG